MLAAVRLPRSLWPCLWTCRPRLDSSAPVQFLQWDEKQLCEGRRLQKTRSVPWLPCGEERGWYTLGKLEFLDCSSGELHGWHVTPLRTQACACQ